jgi:programmed cell death 6-interacting protein
MKEAIIAKVALQASHLYQTAYQLLSMTSIKQIWPKDWLPHVQGRIYAFHALAEYYQSLVAGASSSYGEQISRLKVRLSEVIKGYWESNNIELLFRAVSTFKG